MAGRLVLLRSMLDVHVLFSYSRRMTNSSDMGGADLRVVGRDHLVHVIARALHGFVRTPLHSSTMAGYDAAERVADQLEAFGWQVFRPHVEPHAPQADRRRGR
ncbi:hypothetical protein [Geminicoccus harenae]|uniref:hypothetical protein n=1 Tax=Geminicoccus harenae TaxID=2498453 RepID=UPI00168BA28A|nr:hypothetical protein [Geminicoccus harenae]